MAIMRNSDSDHKHVNYDEEAQAVRVACLELATEALDIARTLEQNPAKVNSHAYQTSWAEMLELCVRDVKKGLNAN